MDECALQLISAGFHLLSRCKSPTRLMSDLATETSASIGFDEIFLLFSGSLYHLLNSGIIDLSRAAHDLSCDETYSLLRSMIMKRNVIVGLIIGLLVFSLACGGGTSTPKPTEVVTLPTTKPAQGDLNIKITNQSPYDICYVQISGSEQEDWGDDWLSAEEKITAGASKTFSPSAGTYDVKVMTCEQTTLATFWNISSNTTVTVGGRGLVPLLVANESSTEICFVFIAPSSSDSWNEDWLGESESIAAQEGMRAFFVTPDTYDLLVQDCDGNDLVTETEVEITEEITWTISD